METNGARARQAKPGPERSRGRRLLPWGDDSSRSPNWGQAPPGIFPPTPVVAAGSCRHSREARAWEPQRVGTPRVLPGTGGRGVQLVEASLASNVQDPGSQGEPSPLAWKQGNKCPEVDEGLWNHLMANRWLRWKRRSMDPDLTPAQRRYAFNRARGMDRPYAERPESCASAGVAVRCGCPGRREVRMFLCGKHLVCETCQRKRTRKNRARIVAGLKAAVERARDRRRLSKSTTVRPHMLTLTTRHTGDIQADRATLAVGWRRFYKSYHRRFGRFEYVGTWEVTPGTDGLGHVHAHIVVMWPYRDWGLMSSLWRAACPGSSHLNVKLIESVKNAALYVAKYISKGVQTDDFSPELRARVLAGTYGTRWLMTSVRFWVPFEPLCPCCGQSVRRAMLRDPFPDAAHSNWRRYECDPSDEIPRWYQVAIEAFQEPE